MPVTIKSNVMKYKNANGEYEGFNAIAQESTEQQIASIELAGRTQVNAVAAKGDEVLDSIPDDYEAINNELSSVKSAIGDLDTTETTASIGSETQGGVKGDIGEQITIVTSTTSYYYWVLSVQDFRELKATIWNRGSSSYPYYVYFTDENDVIISRGIPYTLAINMITQTVTVPEGAAKAYIMTGAQGKDDVVVKVLTAVDLQTQINGLQSDVSDVQAQADALDSRVDGLDSQVDDLSDEITDIDGNVEAIQAEIGTVEAEHDPVTILGDTVGGLQGAVGETPTVTSSTGYHHGYFAVSPGEMYTVKCIQSLSANYPNYVFALTDTIGNGGEIVQLWGNPVETAYDEQTYHVIIPEGADYLYVMANVNTSIGQGATATKDTLTDLQTQITSLKNQVDAIPVDSIPEMVLPSHSYAVVGLEWNLYFVNIFRSLPDKYNIKFTFSRANASNQPKFLDDCLRFTPTNAAQDLGDHTVTVLLQSRETGATIDQGSFVLTVLADTALSGKKVIFIGDSLTDADIMPAQIQYILSGSGITSIGTIENTATIGGQRYTVDDEGRSGWATYDYTRTVENYRTDKTNPFWDGSAFNFGWYIQQNSYTGINAVVIGLGTNGLSRQPEAVAAMDIMIQSIHDYDANLPILISLITPPATQDGCGNHNGIQCAAEQKRKQLDLVKTYISKYDGKLSNVYVAELYFNLDTKRDFPTVQQAASSRNPVQVARQTDNVHPSEYGYLKMADVYYANLLHILS